MATIDLIRRTTIVWRVQGGEDDFISFQLVSVNGNVITDPVMEIRSGSEHTAPLMYSSETATPTLILDQPDAGTAVFMLPGTATQNKVDQAGWWDAYGTDAVGNRKLLGEGIVRISANVTSL